VRGTRFLWKGGFPMASAALNTVYNYYLTTYSPRRSSSYDSHKRSELKSISNKITKMNKDAPVYLLKNVRETSSVAVRMKESARALGGTIASLSGLEDGEILNKKVAFSSNETLASAKFVGAAADALTSPSFELEVDSLASPQVNMGYFMPDEKVALEPDTYSFDLHINDLNYEFQYTVGENVTNREIQNRLAKLINNAGVGLTADVVTNDDGATALRLQSDTVGLPEGREHLFRVSDDHTSKRSGFVDYLGIDYTVQEPSNAEFKINGTPHSAVSNTFTLGNQFEVTLHDAGEEENSATIGLKTDVESLSDNISSLIDGYNAFLRTAQSFHTTKSVNGRLLREMNGITNLYQHKLQAAGLQVEKDGTIDIDEKKLKSAALSGDIDNSFQGIKDFTHSLVRKTKQISLNPMQYTNRTMVSYKNPGHNFVNPYMTSPYIGMMFNSYC